MPTRTVEIGGLEVRPGQRAWERSALDRSTQRKSKCERSPVGNSNPIRSTLSTRQNIGELAD